jgi:hypothetical protein
MRVAVTRLLVVVDVVTRDAEVAEAEERVVVVSKTPRLLASVGVALGVSNAIVIIMTRF